VTGIVSGFVLKLARQPAGLTQEKLAEALSVDVGTVQGWESGRRPLAAMNTGGFLQLCSRLSRLGAPASTGRRLREAVEADQVLSTGIAAGATWVEVDLHPLAASVHRRTIMNLITWPITGRLPPHLREYTAAEVRRRGPAPPCPVLGMDERTRFLDHLLTVAERTPQDNEPLLRRQAVYLLGFDGRPDTIAWLGAESKRIGRQRVHQNDVSGILELRSASIALACAGDPTLLHDLVEHLTDSRACAANLNYWAHWIGEIDSDQSSDEFMLEAHTQSWTGVRLLGHLTTRLEPESHHLPLNLYTLHSLVASRPSLLAGRPDVRASLAEGFARLASTDCLTRIGRDHLAGLQYALRLADR
jgi:transcriptional regulator with XRE-family HTH domain